MSIAALLCISGCHGIKVWENGRYFRMTVDSGTDFQNVRKVGVYVFSHGNTQDAVGKPLDAIDWVSSVITLPHMLYTGDFRPYLGLHSLHYPDEVTRETTMNPDTINAGASLELAGAVTVELRRYGYEPEIVTELGHAGEIPVDSVLANAARNGFQAAFIVYYSGIVNWRSHIPPEEMLVGTGDKTYNGEFKNPDEWGKWYQYHGYLYVPNAAMYDPVTGHVLWSNTYYGLLQNAHVFNLSNEPFTVAAQLALMPYGAPTYVEAAPLAAHLLLKPQLWPDDHVEFPRRKLYR